MLAVNGAVKIHKGQVGIMLRFDLRDVGDCLLKVVDSKTDEMAAGLDTGIQVPLCSVDGLVGWTVTTLAWCVRRASSRW